MGVGLKPKKDEIYETQVLDLKCDPTDLPIRSPHPHRRNRGDGNYHKPIGLLGAEGAPDSWVPFPVLPAVFALILISFRA